ncbi:RNA methyltransferase [Solibacillus sp. FSL H8-0538]|uniref:RNA methyltransferase n=1 Tax=Solibacillus sp. FSL H8-0538 TaxID=2921400 RepID=UPI0030F9FB19
MKKLFQTEQMLQLNRFEVMKYSGDYTIQSITEQQCTCIIKPFSVHITGKELAVKYLQEDGFIILCEELQSFTIERLVL